MYKSDLTVTKIKLNVLCFDLLHAVNLGTLTAMIAHALLIFSSQGAIPYIAMSLMGIAYSIFACVLWPLIAFTVPEYLLGTAYGM